MTSSPSPRLRRLAHARHRLPMVAWLWLLWLLLWGSFTPLVAVGGLLVSAAVVTAFRLPPVTPRVTLRPVLVLRLAGRVAVDLVGSAATVAWAVLRDGRRAKGAVIEVPLAVDSDLLIAVTSLLTTLTPGSLVLEIDRGRRLIYVHELPASDRAAVERRRREVQHDEREVARALGPAATARAVRRPGRDDGDSGDEGDARGDASEERRETP